LYGESPLCKRIIPENFAFPLSLRISPMRNHDKAMKGKKKPSIRLAERAINVRKRFETPIPRIVKAEIDES